MQQRVTFEVIVADDCSAVEYKKELEAFFESRSFSDFKIVRPSSNVKTVANILNALDVAEGRYVKTLGTGDALYDRYTLREICDFLDSNNLDAGFGTCVSFWQDEKSSYSSTLFNAPQNREDYVVDCGLSNKILFANQMLKGDWIPGGTQFFEASLFKRLLKDLSSKYGVLYCEDFAATLLLSSDERSIGYIGKPVVWYEWGEGISTGRDYSSVARLYRDHGSLYRGLLGGNPYGRQYILARLSFALREALSTSRLYFVLRSFVLSTKLMPSENMRDTPNSFFYDCLDGVNVACMGLILSEEVEIGQSPSGVCL